MDPIIGQLTRKSPGNSPIISRSPASPIKSTSKLVLRGSSLRAILQPEGTAQYISEKVRFGLSFAAEEGQRRQEAHMKLRSTQDLNRSLMEQRTMQRSVSLETLERQQAERNRLRGLNALDKSRPDFKSAFNPINHGYDPSSKGRILENYERIAKVRAEQRMTYLDVKSNSTYNLVNGFNRRVFY